MFATTSHAVGLAPREAASTACFPSVDEIRLAALDTTAEESVYARLQAPFSYLSDAERKSHREAARAAVRGTRTWIFEQPSVVETKTRLAVFKSSDGSCGAGSSSVELGQFLGEYLKLLAESCVLQKKVADTLARRDNAGRQAYVRSVEDALTRPDRERLLNEALDVFLEVYDHEQRRFAYGSSLKALIGREMVNYPLESHQLLLTSTRGDFWSRFDRDLLSYCEAPTTKERQRLASVYCNGDDDVLEREIARVRSMPSEQLHQRRAEQRKQACTLEHARIKKGYAKLGDLPSHRVRFSKLASRNISVIDQLLWIDNVLEKVLDHKMLLEHDLYLRLHLVRLLIASASELDASDAEGLTSVVTSLLMPATGRSQSKRAEVESLRLRLSQLFGWESSVFLIPDAELAQLALHVRARLVRKLAPARPVRLHTTQPAMPQAA